MGINAKTLNAIDLFCPHKKKLKKSKVESFLRIVKKWI